MTIARPRNTLVRMRFARLLTLSFTAAGLIASLWALAGPAAARDDALPLPRFVSLKSAEVNLRTGPGTRYPIEWVYKRRALPVEIIAELPIRGWAVNPSPSRSNLTRTRSSRPGAEDKFLESLARIPLLWPNARETSPLS